MATPLPDSEMLSGELPPVCGMASVAFFAPLEGGEKATVATVDCPGASTIGPLWLKLTVYGEPAGVIDAWLGVIVMLPCPACPPLVSVTCRVAVSPTFTLP